MNRISNGIQTIPCILHLLMRGRPKLLGLLGRDGGGHVERQHQLVVAELLVELQLRHEVVREGDDGFDAVLQLAVAEVVQQLAHLKRTDKSEELKVKRIL